ncbi:DNA topoisomerase VI subunit B [Candidatus Woesearchaeota archaeon]|nr:DNA topoisomerase VI subunit B [Candidatus Woesearchaeota archaeon]
MSKAEELAKAQRNISVAEFFEKNRHLLGFDNKQKALLTTIKEAVDNSLDACEEAEILPEISVEVIDMGNDRFRVIVDDNGPGIVKKQVPNIFARLLYGSKFHSLKQSRGQQGIGISASVMYAQLTTGRPAKIISKTEKDKPAYYCELYLDTSTNLPKIVHEEDKEWYKESGTRIEMDLEATYKKGRQSIDEYIKQTAIVNPHATIIYTNPKAEQLIFPRATEQRPPVAQEIKPHPYGVELGILHKMLTTTDERNLSSFLQNNFSRVSPSVAKSICENAALLPTMKPKDITRPLVEKLNEGIKKTKIMAPPTDCINPIGAELIEKGLKKEIKAEFYTSVTRSPSVYRGNPFIIEVGIAYGGEIPSDGQVQVMRFANRVPLLFQQNAGAIAKSITETTFRSYGLQQSKNSLPVGPAIILVHIASVWTPYTSEAKEAIAHYPEIIKDIKLALQECGRALSLYINKKKKLKDELKKKNYIETYIPYIGNALKDILVMGDVEAENVNDILREILEDSRAHRQLETSLDKFREKAKKLKSSDEFDYYEDDEALEDEVENEDEDSNSSSYDEEDNGDEE